MRRFVSAALAVSAITLSLAASSAVQAQTIGNSSFETPALTPGTFQYTPAGATWIFTPNSGISSNGSSFSNGQTSGFGTQVGFVQAQGAFSQSLTGFASGAYTFSFVAAQRIFNPTTTTPSTESFSVLLNGVSLGTFQPTTGNASFQSFTTSAGLMTAGTNTLTFQGLGQTDVSALIDNVTVSRVAAPEPSSALLLVPGLLGLVGVVRRRRK